MHHWSCSARAHGKFTSWRRLLPPLVLPPPSGESPASDRLRHLSSLLPTACERCHVQEGFPGLIQAVTGSWGLVRFTPSLSIGFVPRQRLFPLTQEAAAFVRCWESRGVKTWVWLEGFAVVSTVYLCLCPSLASPGLLSLLPTFLLIL